MPKKHHPTIHSPDLPPEAMKDPMHPPDKPVRAECIHCGRTFSSDEMVWYEGLWCCPHITCGGIGYTIDIWPVS